MTHTHTQRERERERKRPLIEKLKEVDVESIINAIYTCIHAILTHIRREKEAALQQNIEKLKEVDVESIINAMKQGKASKVKDKVMMLREKLGDARRADLLKNVLETLWRRSSVLVSDE